MFDSAGVLACFIDSTLKVAPLRDGYHAAMVALYFMYYNFARVHQTLRVTPAADAGISDHVWNIEEIVNLPSKTA